MVYYMQVSYLTLLDAYVLTCFGLIFLVCIENVAYPALAYDRSTTNDGTPPVELIDEVRMPRYARDEKRVRPRGDASIETPFPPLASIAPAWMWAGVDRRRLSPALCSRTHLLRCESPCDCRAAPRCMAA